MLFCNILNGASQVHENIEQFHVVSSGDRGFLLSCFSEMTALFSQDQFEFQIDADGTVFKLSDSLDLTEDYIETNFEEVGYFEIELTILKSNIDFITIYSISDFLLWLSSGDFIQQFKNWEKAINIHQKFLCLNDKISIRSLGLVFDFDLERLELASVDQYHSRYEKLKGVSSSSRIVSGLTPDYFYLKERTGCAEIDACFDQKFYFLSIAYLFDSVEVLSNNKIDMRLVGYKSHYWEDVDVSMLKLDQFYMYQVYEWVYSSGDVTDKLGLVRNVLSLHVNDQIIPSFDQVVWNAIQSNYQIYLKGNIQSYLEVKSKISSSLMDLTDKTQMLIQNMGEAFKSGVSSLFIFYMISMIVNGVKSVGVENMFTKGYFIILVLVSFMSVSWLLLTVREVKSQFENAESTLKMILSKSFGDLVLDKEISDIYQPIVKSSRDFLNDKIVVYTRWWISIVVTGLLIFIIGMYSINAGKYEGASEDKVANLNVFFERTSI